MFVGRSKELKKLQKLYESDSFEFAVFYGRRRVGKTTLINEFIKDKKAVYYMSVEGTRKENLAGFSKALLSDCHGATPQFPDFESLLGYIDQLAVTGERMIIAIDEFPYLAASYPAISSMLQSHIDLHWKNSRLFLILCGSSMSFMEEQVLGYKSPLYGRRTAQFKLHPFTFFEARKMLPGFSPEEQAVLYGVTGGIPEYLSRISQTRTMDENILELFFDESGRLFEEPVNLLKQELREPASYHSIISAIAGGASRINEIATKTGMETSGCSNQIASLTALGIIRRETPVTEGVSSRKTIYRLEDSMFLFWYRFVRPNMSGIIQNAGETIYEHVVKPNMSDYMGRVFEDMCQQYLYHPQIYATLPFLPGNIGRWWGTDPVKKRQEEIDLMAIQDNQALLGECKWRNAPVNRDILEQLLDRGRLFHHDKISYFLFSKTGFTEDVLDYKEADPSLYLVSFKDICNLE
jgi:AAA+ ATPase superfamily predicted ATPase